VKKGKSRRTEKWREEKLEEQSEAKSFEISLLNQ